MGERLVSSVAGLSLTGRVSAGNGKACPSFNAKLDLNRDMDLMESFPLHYLPASRNQQLLLMKHQLACGKLTSNSEFDVISNRPPLGCTAAR